MTEILKGRKPIGSKWVLKIKRDKRYCARLVCLGYTQVPGEEQYQKYCKMDTIF